MATCYETFRVNEATVTSLLVGCIMESACAVLTFLTSIASLLEWIYKRGTHQLPRFYDDVLSNEYQMTVPAPIPQGNAALPPQFEINPSTPANPPILPSPID